MSADSNVGPGQTGTSALSAAQLESLIAHKEREVTEAAQRAAPLTAQLQLARELIGLRSLRLVGQGASMEIADLTLATLQAGSTIGLLGQVMVDGLKGKVDDSVIEQIAGIRETGLAAIEMTHAVSAAALYERVETFRAGNSAIRKRDLAYAVLFDKLPRKLDSGKR